MNWYRNGIRGPTRPDKANDRAGNAAVREIDRGGSGTNQPSRVSRYVLLAPAASVGGRGKDVKVGVRFGARGALHGDPFRRRMTTRHRGSFDRIERSVGWRGGQPRRLFPLFAHGVHPICRKWESER
jgi:hypothetical protein